MAIRYLHKSWKLFWKIVFSILFIVILLLGGGFIILQLDATQDTIVQNIENSFQQNYKGELIIGELGGNLPFNAVLNDVVLIADSDSARPDTVASVGRMELGVDLLGLLQNRLRIDAFALQEPSVRLFADGSGGYTLLTSLEPVSVDTTDSGGGFFSSWITDFEIIAPAVTISDGSLFIEKFYSDSEKLNLPEPLKVDSINTKLFVELTEKQRFFDIENFTARIEAIETEDIVITGQIFNNEQTLEFNAFHFTVGRSHLHINGEVNDINLYAGKITEQFKKAQYDVTVSSHRLIPAAFSGLYTEIPDVEESLNFTIQLNGALNSLQLQTFKFGTGESYFAIDGSIQNLFEESGLAYEFNIDTLEIHRQDLEKFTAQPNASLFQAIENLRLEGQASGSADSLMLDVNGQSPLGSVTFDGGSQLVEPYKYSGVLTGSGVDIAPFLGASIDSSSLNFETEVQGQNTSLTEGSLNIEGIAVNSFVNQVPIDSLRFSAILDNGLADVSYYYRNENEIIAGGGSANFNKNDPTITLTGETQRFNLATLLNNERFDSTSLNTNFTFNIEGVETDRIHGRASFEVGESIIRGDSVQSHQITMQLSPPDRAERTFVVNSSLFDLRLAGDLQPTNIAQLYRFWGTYFQRRITEEILLDSLSTAPANNTASLEPLQLQGFIEAKNLHLVRNYWPSFPAIDTDSRITFDIRANSSDLEFSSQMQSDTLIINQTKYKNADVNLSGRFRHNKTLKQYSTLHLQTKAARLESDLFDMDSLRMDLQYRRDSLHMSQRIAQFSDSASYNMEMRASLTDSSITAVIENFFLGNSQYAWQESETPAITYGQLGKLKFNSFRFQNENSFIALRGVLSADSTDSLQYIIDDVDLGRISSLLREQIDFNGTLNASLQTSSIPDRPVIEGDLTVRRLEVQDRVIGDLYFASNYNIGEDRFDVNIEVVTDSTEYPDYLAANENIGQNISIEGYFNPYNSDSAQDSTFYLEADFSELDMWVMSLLLSDIFYEIEGSASGSGYITGNLQDLDYHAEIQLDDVFASPAFLRTSYYLNGEVRLDSEGGVILNYVDINDNSGGTGTLYGQVDLNDMEPVKYLDLSIRLDDLKFLDNSYSRDVPFYGSVGGTGDVHLTGSTTNMRLTTDEEIVVSGNSNISILLTEETEITEAGSFIKFVDSFENPEQATDISGLETTEDTPNRAIGELTFSDKVDIDLQFRAPQPIAIDLLFDTETGEELQAEGTGNLRIIMEGNEVQMFGRFDVEGGNYHFVSGSIFSRELEIRPGGFIAWNGPPEEGRLSIEAVYNARPSISSLTTRNLGEGDVSRSVPVNLIVEVTGTVSNIQQDFYFELPGYITSSPTLQLLISQINNNEERKLLQATSILLTGEFLAAGVGARGLGGELRQGSTFINPLISNQIISPLLSNQINSLLSSDSSELDIDFQLNANNQIDLGVALRLYNDKLILQRQGRLTGGRPTNSFVERLGNLSATYRITPNLSVNAFHRQVPTLGVFSPTQATNITPSVDGVGLEASVEFNTWQKLWQKISGVYENIFGLQEQKTDETENNENETPPQNEETEQEE